MSQHSKKRFSTLRTELHRRHQQQQQIQPHRPSAPSLSEPPVPSSPVLSLDAKEMAQYLTLADFYLLKCITANDFLHGSWRSNKIQQSPRSNLCCRDDNDYIHLMTKRANMVCYASLISWECILIDITFQRRHDQLMFYFLLVGRLDQKRSPYTANNQEPYCCFEEDGGNRKRK